MRKHNEMLMVDPFYPFGPAQLNIDLGVFRYWCNHVRPHQNLDGLTPAEAWSEINPHAKLPKQEYWLDA